MFALPIYASRELARIARVCTARKRGGRRRDAGILELSECHQWSSAGSGGLGAALPVNAEKPRFGLSPGECCSGGRISLACLFGEGFHLAVLLSQCCHVQTETRPN